MPRPKTAKTHANAGSRAMQVRHYLTREIRTGRLPPGAFLPSVRELAAKFESSITPAVVALREMEREGLVERIRGSGVRVRALDGPAAAPRILLPVTRAATRVVLGGAQPIATHTIEATQQWAMRTLVGRHDLQVVLAPMDTTRPVAGHDRSALATSFEHILQQALADPPQALCIAEPEFLSDRAVALLRQLAAEGARIAYHATGRLLPDFDRVISDFAQGQYDLTRHALSLGHRRLLRLVGNTDLYWEKRKQEGHARALKEAGFTPAEAERTLLLLGERPPPGPERVGQMMRLLSSALAEHRPTAILALNDAVVAEVRVALRFLGARDLLVTGYDNMWGELQRPMDFNLGQLAQSFPEEVAVDRPPITVDKQLPLVGATLARMVLDRLEDGLEPPPREVLLPQRLIVDPAKAP